jgi:large subunit ribosomal protein L3
MGVGVFGKKLGMTQIFDASGNLLPVTLLRIEDCRVSQVKTIQSDGYNAVQVSYQKESLNKLTKPKLGHLKKAGIDGYRYSGEFRVEDSQDYKLGQKITLNSLSIGQQVKVSGSCIGKGFAGNQKRHNFSRGPMTHGSKNHRLPGSIGAGSTPGRVYPGKKMSGQVGGQKVTIKNSEILFINLEENILVLKGSLPGKKNTTLKIQAQSV